MPHALGRPPQFAGAGSAPVVIRHRYGGQNSDWRGQRGVARGCRLASVRTTIKTAENASDNAPSPRSRRNGDRRSRRLAWVNRARRFPLPFHRRRSADRRPHQTGARSAAGAGRERKSLPLPLQDHAGQGRGGSTPPAAPREERGRSGPVLAVLAMLGPEAGPTRGCARLRSSLRGG
jgi:hypothetical protein